MVVRPSCKASDVDVLRANSHGPLDRDLSPVGLCTVYVIVAVIIHDSDRVRPLDPCSNFARIPLGNVKILHNVRFVARTVRYKLRSV